MMVRRTGFAVGSMAVCLAACSGNGASGKRDVARTKSGLTTYEDVAPIFTKNCLGCHQKGGLAPFELTSYQAAREHGPRIGQVTEERIMPPWLPDSSGECQTYRDQTWLTDDEIATIGKWVTDGMQEGDPRYTPPAAELVPTLKDDSNHLATMTEDYTPDASTDDDYRCFIFDSDVTSDNPVYITDYEFVPGEPRVVHHLIAYQILSAGGVTQAQQLDADDPGPGYSCFGGSGVSARMLMNWAPGSGVVRLPEGTGLTLEPHLPLVVQIHYNLANGPLPDRTSVRMKTSDTVSHPVAPWFFANLAVNLQPQQPSIVTALEIAANQYPAGPSGPATIIGVRAHMHKLGTSSKMEKVSVDPTTGEETRTCLVDIPRYDFHWQRSYFLSEAVALSPGDKLSLSCTFNTMSKDTVTTWGEGTSDEMCLGTFYTYNN